MAALSLLLAAVLIITLFVTTLLKLETGLIIVWIFIGCMGALIVSLCAFILDIHVSLVALKMEIDDQQA
jgi:hypothetical protein